MRRHDSTNSIHLLNPDHVVTNQTERAFVFDLDGTLVETAADLHAVLEEVLSERGIAAPALTELRGMIGDGAKVLVERALAAAGYDDAALANEVYARFLARYAEVPCRMSTAYPGVSEVLGRLKAGGARLGVCTNKPQVPTQGLLDALNLSGLFDAVIGGDVLGRRKPDPGHLGAVLAELAVEPAAAVMIGDSRNDVATARGLGVPCILVSFGYTSIPARELGADAVIDHFAELPAAVAALGRA